MDYLGKKSAAYICYLLVNYWWYVSCFLALLLPFLLTYEYMEGTHPETAFGISMPIDPSLVAVTDSAKTGYLTVKGVIGTVDFDYIVQNKPGTYWAWAFFLFGFIGLYLFGLYQMKLLLRTAVNEAIFTRANSRRIKTIAILILLTGPLKWIQEHFIFESLSSAHPQSFEISLPGPDIGFLLTGLLVYALSTVFEKGRQIYEDQKLTV